MFKTNEVLLKNLIEDVEKGKIQLPDFQRGWVWDDDRIKGLLASVSRGFPMGAVMTLSAGSEIKFRTRPIEGVAAEQMLSCWTASNGLHHCTSLSGIRGQSKPKITTNSESGAGTTWICKGPWIRK